MTNKEKLIEFYNDVTVIDIPILRYLEDDIMIIRSCAKSIYREVGKVRVIIDEIIKMMEEEKENEKIS